MTTLLRCTIEDETGLITDRILSEAEFQDWVARRLGLYEYHDLETARAAALFFAGTEEWRRWEHHDAIIEWTLLTP